MPPIFLLLGLAGLAALLTSSSSSAPGPDDGAAPTPTPTPTPTPGPTRVVFASSPTSSTSSTSPTATKPATTAKPSSAAPKRRWKVGGGAQPPQAGIDFLDQWTNGLPFNGTLTVHVPGTFLEASIVLEVSTGTSTGDGLDVPTAIARAQALGVESAVYRSGKISITL